MGRIEQSRYSPPPEPTGPPRPAKKEYLRNTVSENIDEINRYPVLSRTQEQFLFKALKARKTVKDVASDSDFLQTIQPADEEKIWDTLAESDSVKEVIAKCNLRLVASVARTYGVLPFQERFQEGYFGLNKAIDTFDPTRGKKFSTLATLTIGQAIEKATYWQARPIRLPEEVEQAVSRARKVAQEYVADHYELPSRELWEKELSKDKKLTESQIKNAITTILSGTMNPASLEAPINNNPDAATLGDLLTNTPMEMPSALQGMKQGPLRKAFNAALSAEEVNVLRLLYGLDTHRPQRKVEEIAELFGYSERTIVRFRKSALEKLSDNPKIINLYRKLTFEEEKKSDQEPRTFTPEHRAKLSDAHRGKSLSTEHKKKVRLALLGTKSSLEERTKISQTKKQQFKSNPELATRISESRKNSQLAQEQIVRIGKANSGKKRSAEQRKRLSEINTGKKLSEETRAKMSATRRGKKHSDETRAKIAEAARKREAAKREQREKEKQQQDDSFTQIFPDPNSA